MHSMTLRNLDERLFVSRICIKLIDENCYIGNLPHQADGNYILNVEWTIDEKSYTHSELRCINGEKPCNLHLNLGRPLYNNDCNTHDIYIHFAVGRFNLPNRVSVTLTWQKLALQSTVDELKETIDVLQELVDRPDGAGCKFSYEQIENVLN